MQTQDFNSVRMSSKCIKGSIWTYRDTLLHVYELIRNGNPGRAEIIARVVIMANRQVNLQRIIRKFLYADKEVVGWTKTTDLHDAKIMGGINFNSLAAGSNDPVFWV